MVQLHHWTLLGLANAASASPIYSVPPTQPSGAFAIDVAPVGVSFEFFMWPSYMTNISLTLPCIDHFNDLYGRSMPTRIRGTTQDRAMDDPDFKGHLSYKVGDPLKAPMGLTYGPGSFDLIKKFRRETILGFSRGLNNRTNTSAAVLEAKARNEPQEGANAADWAQDFINHWKSPLPILATSGYGVPITNEPSWPSLPYLVNTAYNQTVLAATKVYNGHLYAFSNAGLTQQIFVPLCRYNENGCSAD